MAEDDGLADGDDAVDVGDAAILGIRVIAVDVILLDVAHGLLLPPQLDGDGVGHNVLCEIHHVLIVSGGEEEHLTFGTEVLVNPDGLILMTLGSDHNIRLVQHKHRDLLQVKEFEFDAPIEHLAGGPDDDVVI